MLSRRGQVRGAVEIPDGLRIGDGTLRSEDTRSIAFLVHFIQNPFAKFRVDQSGALCEVFFLIAMHPMQCNDSFRSCNACSAVCLFVLVGDFDIG